MPRFEEEQRLASWVIWLTYAVLAGAFFIIYSILPDDAEGLNALMLIALPIIIATLAFTMLKMTTIVDGEGVRIKTLYFISRLIEFSEIESAEAVTYRPILDYGGWGLRISHNGKAYNLRGNRGVQLHLTRGRRVMVGSQRADELSAAIEAGMRR